jgi:hypothetical protein
MAVPNGTELRVCGIAERQHAEFDAVKAGAASLINSA